MGVPYPKENTLSDEGIFFWLTLMDEVKAL